MAQYHIEHRDGWIYGIFSASSEAGALDSAAQDAGYSDYRSMREELGGECPYIVTEVDDISEFLTGFARGAGISRAEADEQWQWYSRQLTDADRAKLHAGGEEAGEREGRRFNDEFPPEVEE
jgi:hypothetical protein